VYTHYWSIDGEFTHIEVTLSYVIKVIKFYYIMVIEFTLSKKGIVQNVDMFAISVAYIMEH